MLRDANFSSRAGPQHGDRILLVTNRMRVCTLLVCVSSTDSIDIRPMVSRPVFRNTAEEQAFIEGIIQPTAATHATRLSGPTTAEDDAATRSYLNGLGLQASVIGPPTSAAEDSVTRTYLDSIGLTAKRLRSSTTDDDTANRSYVDGLGVYAAQAKRLRGEAKTDDVANVAYIDSLGVSAAQAKRLLSATSTDDDHNRNYINSLGVSAGAARTLQASPLNPADVDDNAFSVRAVLGVGMRPPVVAVVTIPVTGLRPGDVWGGYSLQENDRALLMGQWNAPENGVYVVQGSGNLQRSTDMAEGFRCAGSLVLCTTNMTMFLCISPQHHDAVGQDPLVWTEVAWDEDSVRRFVTRLLFSGAEHFQTTAGPNHHHISMVWGLRRSRLIV